MRKVLKSLCAFSFYCVFCFHGKAQEYFDYQATTPCDPRVISAMAPYWTKEFGNPHAHHAFGERAAAALLKARQQIADILGGKTRDWIFTSGATEANALAIKGVMLAAPYGKKHLITCVTEHKSVLDTCRFLAQQGCKVTVLPVDREGHLSLTLLKKAIRPETMLVSIMAANNEIGVIHPLSQIAKICHDRGVLLHTDATQAIGQIPFSISLTHADLVSFSGHKIYCPKGIGALYVAPHVVLTPLFHGGGQERGLRAGTVPVPLCVGLAKALEIAEEKRSTESQRLSLLQKAFLQRLRTLKGWCLNGSLKERLPNNLNISIEGVDSEDLLAALSEFALSTGSACNSDIHFSHVLEALDPEGILPPATLRISFGRYTTEVSVHRLADRLIETVEKLRHIKPFGGKRACKTKKGMIAH
ncbi:MAG: cysteine desulfurase [Holosporales bacterium]|jgi:cysteine desulfurase|nr:cysteine desulfurase [Holosporales bacterium]